MPRKQTIPLRRDREYWHSIVHKYWKKRVWKALIEDERREKRDPDYDPRQVDLTRLMAESLFNAWAESLEAQYKQGVADGKREAKGLVP